MIFTRSFDIAFTDEYIVISRNNRVKDSRHNLYGDNVISHSSLMRIQKIIWSLPMHNVIVGRDGVWFHGNSNNYRGFRSW